MEYTKLLVDGCWVNRGTSDEPKWELMVYPVVTKFEDIEGVVGSFVLLDTDKCISSIRYDSINKIFDRAEPSRDMTLHNFGEYTCNEGMEWQLFLTAKIPYIKDNAFSAQVTKGYVFLDDIKPKDTEDDLDMWIYNSLKSLTGPRTIHFNKEA